MSGNILYHAAMEDDVNLDQAHHELLHTEVLNGSTPVSSTNSPAPVRRKRKAKCGRNLGKLLRTASLCAGYFGLGLCMAVTGPTLPQLQAQVGASVGKIAYIFTARSVGVLTGSLASGFLFDRYNRYSLLFLVTLCMGIGVGSMPWCRQLWLLMCSSFMIGIGGGFLDAGTSVLCLELWGKDAGPYMQALHFSFGVGGFVAPLLAQPFLTTVAVSHETNITRRFVRSAAEYPLNFNATEATEDFNLTAKAIVNAVEMFNVPEKLAEQNATTGLLYNTTSESVSTVNQTFNAMLNLPAAPNDNEILETTTAEGPDDPTTTTKPPKPKPKPSVIDGSLLGKSEIWEKIPLPQVPASAEENPPATTASTAGAILSGNSSLALNGTTAETSVQSNLTQTTESSDNTTLFSTTTTASTTVGSNTTVQSENSTAVPTATRDGVNAELNATAIEGSANISAVENVTTPVLAVESVSSNTSGSSAAINTTTVSEVAENSTTTKSPVILNATTESLVPQTSSENTTTTTTEATTGIAVIPLNTTPYSTITEITDKPTEPSIVVTLADDKPYSGSTVAATNQENAEKSKIANSAIPVTPETTTPASPAAGINTTTELSATEIVETTSPSGFVTKSRGKSRGQQDEATENTTRDNSSTLVNESERTGLNLDWEKYGVTRMHLLYSIIAIIVIHISFTFLFFLCTSERDRSTTVAASSRGPSGLKPRKKLMIIGLLFFVFLFYVGMEVSYSQYLTTFGMQSQLQLPEKTANYITAIFWGAFALARLAGIFIASFTKPSYMLFGNFIVCLITSLMLSVSGQTNQTLLSVSSAVMGIGMASTFATIFVWTEKRLAVTNRIAAAFSVASSLGEMIGPAITGALLEHEAMSLMYYTLISNSICLGLLIGAWFLSKRKRGLATEAIFSANDYQLAKQGDDEHELN